MRVREGSEEPGGVLVDMEGALRRCRGPGGSLGRGVLNWRELMDGLGRRVVR